MKKLNDMKTEANAVASNALLGSWVANIRGDCVEIQEALYIEDGAFIRIVGGTFSVFWIPAFGGDEQHCKDFSDLIEAWRYAQSLA